MTANIFTLGYESSTIEDFLCTLQRVDIELIIDVREYPLSRKKGFSKNILADLLKANGIEYVHLKGLGDPKEGREAARSGNQQKFLQIFSEHMQSEHALSDLKIAVDLAKSKTVCLLCFERNHEECHRTIVAREISKVTGQQVSPIGVRSGISSSGNFSYKIPETNSGYTYA